MSSYPDKFPRDSFKTHINISHEPSGFKFYQVGGRINVLAPREDGVYFLFTDFTTQELQEGVGVTLTESQLIRTAIQWMKVNWK